MNALRMMVLALICLGASTKVQALNIPRLNGRVNDTAGILTRDEATCIESSLKDYENKTSNQIVILTTRDLQGESIESYANQIFRSWKLGQKDKNNGILIVISVGAKNTARIEVGYGLEGVVPDAIARAIINDDMKPLFKEKKYQACLMAAVNSIERSIGGEYKAKPNTNSGSASSDNALNASLMGIGLSLLVLFVVAALFCLIHRFVGGIAGGVGTFFIVNFFLSSWPIALVAALIGFAVGLVSKDILEGITSGSSGSSSGGSWSGGGGSSDSSFSGGGGSSGGGGASGGLD